jgi:hypothetical protein
MAYVMIMDFAPDFSRHFGYFWEFLAKFPDFLREKEI